MQYTFPPPKPFAVRLAGAVRATNQLLHRHRDGTVLTLQYAESLLFKVYALLKAAGYSVNINNHAATIDLYPPRVYRLEDKHQEWFPDDAIIPASDLQVCTLDAEHWYDIQTLDSNLWCLLDAPVCPEIEGYLRDQGFVQRPSGFRVLKYTKSDDSPDVRAATIKFLNETLLSCNETVCHCPYGQSLANTLLAEAGYTVRECTKTSALVEIEAPSRSTSGGESYVYTAYNWEKRLIPAGCMIVEDKVSLAYGRIYQALTRAFFTEDRIELPLRVGECPELVAALKDAGYWTAFGNTTLYAIIDPSSQEPSE